MEIETNGSDIDMVTEEEDEEETKGPVEKELNSKKRPPRKSNGEPQRKRVRFTGVKTRSR